MEFKGETKVCTWVNVDKLLAIRATISMVLYGKAQCCSSTYTLKLHNSIIILSCNCSNEKCEEAVKQFAHAAALTTDELPNITNNKVFIFDHKKCISYYLTLDLNLFTENKASILKAVTLKESWQILHP